MIDPSKALDGPIAISVGLRPEPPHELVYFMGIADSEQEGTVGVVIGMKDNLTELLGTFIRVQNMGDQAESLMIERGATTVGERMAVLSEVAELFADPDGENTERGI